MTISQGDHDSRITRPWSLDERSGTILLVILVPAILVLDYTAGRDFSLHLFYLVPTGLAAWSFGGRAGCAVGLVAAAYWAFVGFATRQPNAPAMSLAWDVLSTVLLFLFFAYVVARHRAFVDNLLEMARIDTVSGALSKREFGRVFESEVRRSRRYRRPLALAMFDVAAKDMGRKGADFLQAVVRAVQLQVRDSDSVGRISDRRLAIVLLECRPAEALVVSTRIRDGVTAALNVAPPAVGVASYGGNGVVTAPDLMQIASNQVGIAQGGSGQSESHID